MTSDIDFYICYNKADKKLADWVGICLEENNYKVWTPDWDILPGNNEVNEIQKALEDASAENKVRRIIIILSPNFGKETNQENLWRPISRQDYDGTKRMLIPIIFQQETLVPKILDEIKSIDLSQFNNDDDELATQHLLSGINSQHGKPLTKPNYPGSQSQSNRPPYPSSTAKTFADLRTNHTESNNTQQKTRNPAYQLGLLNRTSQRNHFVKHIPKNSCLKNGQAQGFLLLGPRQEWPQGIRYKLSYLLGMDLIGDRKQSPDLKTLRTEKSMVGNVPAQYLWELLALDLNCKAEETVIQQRLKQLSNCHIFYRDLPSDEAENHEFLVDMLLAWSKIKLDPSSPSHFLLFTIESDYLKKSKSSWLPFTKRRLHWQQQVENLLNKNNLKKSLLPQLDSPNHKDISNWMKLHVEEPQQDKIQKILKKEFPGSTGIPLADLKSVLLPVI